LEELALAYDEKNIADPAISEELVTRGGKRQVPYLVDDASGTEMYESNDIVEYLASTYGSEDQGEATSPLAQNVCIPDELAK
jgi:glutathione S-transferase